MATPVIGDVLTRVVKPNAKMVVQLLSSVGEKDTIVRYPDLIESVVAAGRPPVSSAANLAELRAIISAFGFRPAMRVSPEDLRRLTVPTLLVWGDHDPVGGVDVAQETARLIPDAQLEVLLWGTSPGLATRTGCPSSCLLSSAQEADDVIRLEAAHRFDVCVERGFAFIPDTANWSRFWPGYLRLEGGSTCFYSCSAALSSSSFGGEGACLTSTPGA